MPNLSQIDDASLLAHFSRTYRSVIESYMEEVDMHRGQSMLLRTIVDQDGMTQSELADQLSVQGATVTNMVQRMEERGLVVRKRDSDDNRLVRVYVTDTGREMEQLIGRQFKEVEALLFRGIGEEDRLVLRRLVYHMLQNIDRRE